MDSIQRQVNKVWRRLVLRQFMFALGRSWFGALSSTLLVMAVARYRPLPVRDYLLLAAALGVGFVVALLITWLRLPRVLEAAWEIDRRFELQERVSSALCMKANERASDAGRALLADAQSCLKRVDLNERFTVSPPRQLFLAVLPGLLALLLTLRPVAAPSLEGETVDGPSQQVEFKKAVGVLHDRLSRKRQKTEKSDLATSELLKKIDDATKEILAQPNREKVLVKLNRLENMLRDRHNQLGDVDSVKRQLEQLKNNEAGPADTLAQALARGDFKRASYAVEKLKQEFAKIGLGDEQNQSLAKQLEELHNKLAKMARQTNDARGDLQQRADQLTSSGDAASAKKLQDQVDQMMQNPQSQSLQKLADALGQCAQGMKQASKAQASKAMQQALDQLKNLANQSNELATVDSAMRQIAEARNRMNCKNCGGAGCNECQGDAVERNDAEGKYGQGGDASSSVASAGDGESDSKSVTAGQVDGENLNPDRGIGRARGKNARAEKEIGGKFYDSSVKQKVTQGPGIVTDMVDGPNLKGHALAEIRKETRDVEQGSTDPLSGQRLPKQYAKFAREYFDRVRDDEK